MKLHQEALKAKHHQLINSKENSTLRPNNNMHYSKVLSAGGKLFKEYERMGTKPQNKDWGDF